MLNPDVLKRWIDKWVAPAPQNQSAPHDETVTLEDWQKISARGVIPPGTTINSRFKIRGPLTTGGMGLICLAEDLHLQLPVVIKFVLPQYVFDREFDARFEREAKALARVNHANVVMVYEYGKHEEQAFIAMGYVRGKSLRELLNNGEPFSTARVIDIGMQICAGLDQAHRAGVTHRDIKPSNLLIGKRDQVTIIDFGIAKMEGTTQYTLTGKQPGTLDYMSPEQARGEKLDLRSDIFSLGVVLYELLAGRRPFQGQYDPAVRYALEYGTPEPLAKHNPQVTVGLQRLMDKALAKAPDQRYQRLEEMWRDLKTEKERPTAIAVLPPDAPSLERTLLQAGPFKMALPPSTTAALDSPEGIVAPESKFYVERDGDKAILEEVGRQGATIIILGPQKIGKSCLLARLRLFAERLGKKFALVNFRQIDAETFRDTEGFYRRFCALIAEALEMEVRLDEHWKPDLSNNDRCSRYVSRYILKTLKTPVVLALDDVDRLFEAAFRDNFFGMLRSWHSNRAIEPIWKQLDLALVTAAEPNRFIRNRQQSPFNVGRSIELEDFTPLQVVELNRLHNSPLNKKEEEKLFDLVGGHPYLVRLALYGVAAKQYEAAELFAKATDDNGPFGEHLQYLMQQLSDQPELLAGLKQIIRQQSSADDDVYYHLHAMGLVVRRDKYVVVPRCKLYGEYFREVIQ
jgi:hypothetical protein